MESGNLLLAALQHDRNMQQQLAAQQLQIDQQQQLNQQPPQPLQSDQQRAQRQNELQLDQRSRHHDVVRDVWGQQDWSQQEMYGSAALMGQARGRQLRQPRVASMVQTRTRSGQPNLYIPNIGVGNITEPTALPPPPPVLDPVRDSQPIDTAVGDYIMKQFVEPPTVTPPPLQSALSALNACPLLFMPARFTVRSDDGCSSSRQNIWFSGNDKSGKILNWNESCSSVGGATTYTLPSKATMGVSKSHVDPTVDAWDVYHCDGLTLLYTFSEKVFKRQDKGTVDPVVCKKYGICDGTVYIQYSVKDPFGTLIGVTGLLPLYLGEFALTDPGGVPIAKFVKNGNWGAKDVCASYHKDWLVTIGTSNSPLTATVNRWIVGTFATVFAMRDTDRDSAGIVKPSTCSIVTGATLTGVLVGLILGTLIGLACVYIYFVDRVTSFCFKIEAFTFPKTMMKPSRFDP